MRARTTNSPPRPPLFSARRVAACLFLLAGLAGAPRSAAADEAAALRADQTVVLLHGMGRGRASLWVLDMRLRQAGYKTLNFPYLANSQSLDGLSERLRVFIREKVKTPTYHLVAHSLGNVIIRNTFKLELPPGLGRIVMLAPPNKPAELARALRENPVYRWFTGESGQQLGSEEFYAELPAPKAEFGIIAGDRGQSVTFNSPNDGVITVESTRLEGMKDWVLVHHSHTFIMNSRQVAQLCVQFLESGRFNLDALDAEIATDELAETGQDTGDTAPLPGE